MDPYELIKNKENQLALDHLPQRLKKLDLLSEKEKLKDIINGVLAGKFIFFFFFFFKKKKPQNINQNQNEIKIIGNMFDWGAKDVMELMLRGELDFENAGQKIHRPGLKDNYSDFEKRFLEGSPYKKTFIFVDNSGADTILGVLPFARELLKRFFSLSFFFLSEIKQINKKKKNSKWFNCCISSKFITCFK